MRIDFKKIVQLFSITIFFSLLAFATRAQTTVTGKITDLKDGAGLSGVTVNVKGTKNSVQTDAGGNFSIKVPANTSTLVVSSVGYAVQQVPVNGRSVIDISIAQNSTTLSDVVVVAYGDQMQD